LVVVLAMACCCCSCSFGEGRDLKARPIPDWLITPWESFRVLWSWLFGQDAGRSAECEDFVRFHPVDVPRPIVHVEVPRHPFMAANGGNNMHCDSYITDTYEIPGPIGGHPEIISRTQGFGGYGTIAYDRFGQLVAVHSDGRGFQLELMDPDSLAELASYNLPPRPVYWLLQGILPWEYIGAGMYFYLDNQDRAVVPTTENTVQVVQIPPEGGTFRLVREYDLSEFVVPLRWPKRDSVAWVLPDWSGAYYWYATTAGMVGTVDVDTGEVRTLRLDGEIIENSFAVAEDGVFILSDHALYRFSQNGRGKIAIDWRTPYDRGPHKKPGHITRGSGTSVTLVGESDGLVVITDNAEPRIHLIFAERSDGTVVCSTPLFEAGKSGTDVSVACVAHADASGEPTGVYSALAENNWGHHSFPHSQPEPGLVRVDAVRQDDGTYSCEQVWASHQKSIGVFKLSLGSGMAYMYWRSECCPVTSWYFIAVDFATGETVYQKLVGTGLGHNNWAGALFLHPDGGVAYSTTIFGLVMIRDTHP